LAPVAQGLPVAARFLPAAIPLLLQLHLSEVVGEVTARHYLKQGGLVVAEVILTVPQVLLELLTKDLQVVLAPNRDWHTAQAVVVGPEL